MKHMMIDFIGEKVGWENEAAFEDMTQRMMNGEYADEFREFLKSRLG